MRYFIYILITFTSALYGSSHRQAITPSEKRKIQIIDDEYVKAKEAHELDWELDKRAARAHVTGSMQRPYTKHDKQKALLKRRYMYALKRAARSAQSGEAKKLLAPFMQAPTTFDKEQILTQLERQEGGTTILEGHLVDLAIEYEMKQILLMKGQGGMPIPESQLLLELEKLNRMQEVCANEQDELNLAQRVMRAIETRRARLTVEQGEVQLMQLALEESGTAHREVAELIALAKVYATEKAALDAAFSQSKK